jgi:hypothetical protein
LHFWEKHTENSIQKYENEKFNITLELQETEKHMLEQLDPKVVEVMKKVVRDEMKKEQEATT